MRIRPKRTILLLTIALVPSVLIAVLYTRSISHTGKTLAGKMRETLLYNAEQYLQSTVGDYGRISTLNRITVELALARQAQEVERRLAGAAPAGSVLYYSQDYDVPARRPVDTKETPLYQKTVKGRKVPIPVSFAEQVFFPVRGVARSAIEADMARLSTMPSVYRELTEAYPNMFTWLYTSLQTGFHSCYPGHGGYPAEYDPRPRPWYTRARDANGLAWTLLPNVSTRTVTLTAAMPVRRSDGSFAGVTAIDIRLESILGRVSLPAGWRDSATVLHVTPAILEEEAVEQLHIIAQDSYIERGQQWQRSLDLEVLESSEQEPLDALKADLLAERSGVRRMLYKGRDSLWAYGRWNRPHPVAIVIIPYDRVVAEAAEAESLILKKIIRAIVAVGLVLIGVLGVVSVIAVLSSRSITRPVSQLARAAHDLSTGNFDARVNISTRDELQELGETFNNMGPRLRDREQMKRSLELAREIQQRLLPQEQPQLPGFDIAGRSVYCDETGGDYFDFIDLSVFQPGALGIALGDVTGHGIPAALLMAGARSLLRSQAGSYVDQLAALFGKMNSHLVSDTDADRFITLFYGVLDANNHTLIWASAGHDPAIWLRPGNGKVRELCTTGIPLGIMDGALFGDEGPVSLAKGDVVLVGTDGIWEAQNKADEQFGKDRLLQILCEQASESSEEIISSVVEAVDDFRGGGAQKDDITMIVIKSL